MKKLFSTILVLGLLLAACTSNTQGGKTIGLRGSSAWLKWAPYEDLVNYYSEYDVDEICHSWKYFDDASEFARKKNRNAMKAVLKDKGQDPYICMKLPST